MLWYRGLILFFHMWFSSFLNTVYWINYLLLKEYSWLPCGTLIDPLLLLYLVAQLCLTLCDPVNCSLPGSTVHGIFQARILEWIAISFCGVSSWPRDQTHGACVSCTAGEFLTCWATGEAISWPYVRVYFWTCDFSIDLCVYFSACIILFWSLWCCCCFSSVQLLSHVWLFATPWTAARQDSLSITTPKACSSSCPSSQWCHPITSSSVVPFSSRLQSFPASGSFLMNQFFASGGQSIGVSASASVFPMNIQDWFPLEWTGWISLQSKGLSRVSSITIVQKYQFFSTQLSL